jgi:hypothetical protein
VVLSVNQRKWMFDSWSMHDYEQNLTLDYMKTCLVGWSFSVRFGFYKKMVTKPIFFQKTNRNRFKPTGFGLVRLFENKNCFFCLARFFPGLARFFRFQVYKTETKLNWLIF